MLLRRAPSPLLPEGGLRRRQRTVGGLHCDVLCRVDWIVLAKLVSREDVVGDVVEDVTFVTPAQLVFTLETALRLFRHVFVFRRTLRAHHLFSHPPPLVVVPSAVGPSVLCLAFLFGQAWP